MSGPVDRLVDLLDLERIEADIFRGASLDEPRLRVFGGQVAGQALVASGRTVDPGRPVHSLHAYFIRPGRPGVPIVYQVERIRDGRSFTTRRVVAVQNGKVIFNLTASFHRPEEGFDHQLAMPEVPAPEDLPPLADEIREHDPELLTSATTLGQPFDIRAVQRPLWRQADVAGAEPRMLMWVRARAPLGDDPLVHVCAATYASDLMLLNVIRIPVEPLFGPYGFDMASLDHALWFHRPFRADDWLLFRHEGVSASAGRALGRGHVFTRDGRQVMSMIQEGLMRPLRDRRPPGGRGAAPEAAPDEPGRPCS